MLSLVIPLALITASSGDSSPLKVGEAHPAPGAKGEIAIGSSVYIIGGDPAVSGPNLACYRSDDRGGHWQKLGSIFIDPIEGADLGDGNLLRLPDGRILAVYRRNHYRGQYRTSPEYGIQISESSDNGVTWHGHSIVSQHRIDQVGVSRGFWAPFLFLTRSGKLQCYYDDEYTPYEKGFKGHQWVEMKTFDPLRHEWTDEKTVSRAPDPRELSRDGMATVVEPSPGKLVCLLESVSTSPPVVGNIREVTSSDGGKTWSWEHGERPIAYQSPSPYHSFSPWTVITRNGLIFCVFATDEDNDSPKPAGTPAGRLKLDIKAIVSRDHGKSWSPPFVIYLGTHHNYLPSGTVLDRNTLLLSLLDFDRGALSAEAQLAPGR